MTPRLLIAGIGNIFLGDDAFGCEVVQRLLRRSWPSEILVKDFGIRGLDLAYALLEDFQSVILIDAAPRGQAPGTLYVIEPDLSCLQSPDVSREMIDAHTMNPEKVLRLTASMGAQLGNIRLVACEPQPFDPDIDMPRGLSRPVAAALDGAVDLVLSLVKDFSVNGPSANDLSLDARNPAGAGAASMQLNPGAAKEHSHG